MIFNIGIRRKAISVQANLLIVGARFIGRLALKEIAQQAELLHVMLRCFMARSNLIMAGGTGGHIFSSDITRKNCPLAFSENMANAEVIHG